MNYLFSASKKSYFSKEPIFRLFKPPPRPPPPPPPPLECQRPIYKLCNTAFIDDVTVNMTSQRCTKRSLPNYLVMTSYHWNVRQNILA